MPCEVLRKEIDNLYREAIEDIQYLKQQQWKIVAYALSLFGVLIYLKDKIYKIPTQDIGIPLILTIAAFSIGLFGLYFLIDIQEGLQKNRMYITMIRYGYFHDETIKILDYVSGKDIESYCDFWKDKGYFIGFGLTIVVAFGFVFYIIWKDVPLTIILTIILGAVSSVWADC